MDETAIKARVVILHARATIVGGKGLKKTEAVAPEIGSAACGCTAAFTIAEAGDTAPPFLVVEGGKEGHACVRYNPSDGSLAASIPLSSWLKEGATFVRRTPAGFDKNTFDTDAAHFASFATNFFPAEARSWRWTGRRFICRPSV